MSNDGYPTPPAWVEAEAADAKRKAAITKARAEAAPITLVKIDISFGTVFSLAVQVAISQTIIAVVVLLMLRVTGVIDWP